MFTDPENMPKVMRLYLEISQYPVLAGRIRHEMREELYSRGIITRADMEDAVRERAIQSQQLEGFTDPLIQEPSFQWEERKNTIRDYLTDFYFAYNLPHEDFRSIVRKVVSLRAPDREPVLAFNPELAPWDLLISQGKAFAERPPEARQAVEHHLRQIIVVLIRAMISDQLSFVRIARNVFTIHDLEWIRSRRIGRGKIGGKAGGMLLAYRILQQQAEAQGLDLAGRLSIPESWYLGSDVYYDFHMTNNLFRFMNQKYKLHEDRITDYPDIHQAYLEGVMPGYVMDSLKELLEEVDGAPLIVRSSSLLEDSADTSFAGKYDSFFLPNQGTPQQNLDALIQAIVSVYASVVRPEALIYREQMELIDYDERMALLIQKVQGERHGRYFFPAISGVAFSHNPYQWDKRIDRDAGLLRMVTGLGTRAVDRVGRDYPRMVALSHPTLRPENDALMIRRYSQHMVDVIDLEENAVVSVPLHQIVGLDYPGLGAIMGTDQDNFIAPFTRRPLDIDTTNLVVTFDRLLGEGAFVEAMRDSLRILQEAYGRPVDVEFAAEVTKSYPTPETHIYILQCRPLSQRLERGAVAIPEVPEERILFKTRGQVPNGTVEDIEVIVYVDPHAYHHNADAETRVGIGRVVGKLNYTLRDSVFVLMGPGRWGSSNINLGVRVTYAEIYNARSLIEVAYAGDGSAPELSHGTHFFQDLVEADIYPLPVYPDAPDAIYQEAFFTESPNLLAELLPEEAEYAPFIRVIDVRQSTGGELAHIVMNGERDQAIAYLE